MAISKLQLFTQTLAKHFQVSPEVLLASFYPAREEDLPSIIAFRNQHLGEGICWDDEKYFRWRYNFSSEECEHPRSLNRVWVFRLHGKLLGILGNIQVPLHVGNQTIVATHPLDVLVDQSIEGLGVGAWMQFVFNDSTHAMLVIGANEKSNSIVKRIFHRLPDRQVWKLAVSSASLIYRYIPNRFAAKSFSLVLDAWQNIFRSLRNIFFSSSEYSLREIAKFDASVNVIGESWRDRANYRARTADYLNWRFFENPNKSYESLGLFEAERCIAYVIFHRNESAHSHYLYIDDFCWLQSPESDRLLFTLMHSLVDWCKQKSVDIIILQSYGTFARAALSRYGFIERPEHLLFSVSCNIPSLESQMYNADLWFVTAADAHGGGL